ncbi:hypothetical protein D3874_18585 [Oleomonas cavernae]|uniref:Uncharacterized protein n=1 Tax=Oleomonas cavernae TaxID=2320859 RepID=A0A418WFE6_9PROT|nr:hypothetical protein [Oleomonas cavernae]RJF88747.1 hypothetical protein D3874_18585 [Oleomonas cavernae]
MNTTKASPSVTARLAKLAVFVLAAGLLVNIAACGARLGGSANGGSGRSSSASGGISIPFP